MRAPLHLWHRTFSGGHTLRLSFAELSHFSRGLAKGYCSFLLINVCHGGFAETRCRGRRVWWGVGLVLLDLDCAKTSERRTLKRRCSICRTIHCPQTPHRLLKRSRAFCTSQIIYTTPYINFTTLAPQTVSQIHRNRHLRNLPSPLESAGKVLNILRKIGVGCKNRRRRFLLPWKMWWGDCRLACCGGWGIRIIMDFIEEYI